MSTITNYNKLTSQEWNALYDSLMTEKNPNTDTLKQFLDAPYKKVFTQADSEQYHYDYIKALKLKYDALTTIPSTIEKTMTPAQLYTSNSPLWVHDYKAVTIECILPHLKDKPRTEETFNEALAAIFKPKTVHTDKYGRTYIN